MPLWVPKAGVAPVINLGQAFTALITGDANWSWLLGWVSDIGAITYNTADFCSAGPSAVSPLQPSDFLTDFANPLVLGAKIRAVADDRVFAAFCEMPGASGAVWTDYECAVISSTHGGFGTVYSPIATIPADALRMRLKFTGSPNPAAAYVFGHSNDGVNMTYSWPAPLLDGTPNESALPSAGGVAAGMLFQARIDGGPAAPTVCVSFQRASAWVDHTPTTQPPVVGALPPQSNIYLTIGDLGKELDTQEYKLDQLRQTIAFLLQSIAPVALGGADIATTPPVPAVPGVPVPAGAVAAVVLVDAVPNSADIEFTDPLKYARLGTITLGSPAGWLPSIQLEHSPQLVAPLPAWVTEVRVHCFPPATATVSFLTAL